MHSRIRPKISITPIEIAVLSIIIIVAISLFIPVIDNIFN